MKLHPMKQGTLWAFVMILGLIYGFEISYFENKIDMINTPPCLEKVSNFEQLSRECIVTYRYMKKEIDILEKELKDEFMQVANKIKSTQSVVGELDYLHIVNPDVDSLGSSQEKMEDKLIHLVNKKKDLDKLMKVFYDKSNNVKGHMQKFKRLKSDL